MPKKMFSLLMVTVMFAIMGAVAAQDSSGIYCGELAQADCALLTESARAMSGLSGSEFRFDMDMSFENLSGVGVPVTLRFNGSGAYSVDTERALSFGALVSQFEALEHMLQTVDADATIIMHLPAVLVEASQFSDTPLPEKVSLSLRLVDGFMYFNLDKLAEMDPQGALPMGWMGMDLLNLAWETLAVQGGLIDMAELPPTIFASYLSVERLEDVDIAGQPAAAFRITTDYGALYANPEYRAFLREQLLDAPDARPADVARMLDGYEDLYRGLVIETVEHIGLDDRYLHQVNVRFAWEIDVTALDRIGGTGSFQGMDPVMLRVYLQVDVDHFNAVTPISVPPDAIIIPLEGAPSRRAEVPAAF